jgi:hypothetical protein
MIYDGTTIVASLNGAPYVAIGTLGAVSLQAAYNVGQSIAILPGVPVTISDAALGTALLVPSGVISSPDPVGGANTEHFGAASIVSGVEGCAFGSGARASASSNAFGFQTNAGFVSATFACNAFGYQAVADGASGCLAVGHQASATGQDAIALGSLTSSTNQNSMALGNTAAASGSGSVAVGGISSATGLADVAVGFTAAASGGNSVAVGRTATTLGAEAVAIGHSAAAPALNCIAIGPGSLASGAPSIAIGPSATAPGPGSIAIGFGNVAAGTNGIAIGGVAIGADSVTVGGSAIGGNNTIIGRGAASGPPAFTGSIALGRGAICVASAQCKIGSVGFPINDFRIDGTPQISFGTAASGMYGGALGVVVSMPAVLVPPGGPTPGVGIFFVDPAGGLSFKGAAGTVTPIAPP